MSTPHSMSSLSVSRSGALSRFTLALFLSLVFESPSYVFRNPGLPLPNSASEPARYTVLHLQPSTSARTHMSCHVMSSEGHIQHPGL